MKAPVSAVVLISGSGSNLQAIIDAINRGEINAELKAVISNRRGAFGLQRARRAAIPSEVIDHAEFRDRSAFDRELVRRIGAYRPKLIVLAGFMRILTPVFINRFEGCVLNIHPSLLPKLRGLHTHERALESGERTHGCSVHFVTNELDGGPVILQARVPVLAGDTPATLAARVLEKEHIIYPLCIRWYCEGRLFMANGQVMMNGKPLLKPLLLDELQIDSRV
jgi:phosphoribosylglycinamide formyltransferase-1